ncbi:MAG: DNA topoisomerase, partial [Gemmatimonadaceae bacterium]
MAKVPARPAAAAAAAAAGRKAGGARKAGPGRKTGAGKRNAAAKVPARRRRTAGAYDPSDLGDAAAPTGSTSLVIVESPAKARTIGKYLGRGYRVRATVGHIRDLPAKKLGIDVDAGFEPEYVTIPGKEKTVADLREAARGSREIFLATDPDREGEAIAWHVAEQVRPSNGGGGRRGRGRGKRAKVAGMVDSAGVAANVPIRRVLFHEITRDAVRKAIAEAGEIDGRKVEAQQARRVLDRLVGYKASPLLWKTVKKGLSAGRVQTVALRLIVERERDIRAFTAVEYWTIEALLEKDGQRFTAKLHHVDGKKTEIGNEQSATGVVKEVERIAADLRRSSGGPRARGSKGVGFFPVTEVKRRERRKNPAAPFTTSTLQQEAAKKLGFGSKRTMRLAQDLYEGIDVGDGAVGLITYMRTDSTRISQTAAEQARDYLRTLFGKEFLPAAPQLYGGGKGAA